MDFGEWKIKLARELIKIQHSTDNEKLKLDIIELLEALRYAKRRDLYSILYKLNVIITNHGLTQLLKYIDELDLEKVEKEVDD